MRKAAVQFKVQPTNLGQKDSLKCQSKSNKLLVGSDIMKNQKLDCSGFFGRKVTANPAN